MKYTLTLSQQMWLRSRWWNPLSPVIVKHPWLDHSWYLFGPSLPLEGEQYYTWEEAMEKAFEYYYA